MSEDDVKSVVFMKNERIEAILWLLSTPNYSRGGCEFTEIFYRTRHGRLFLVFENGRLVWGKRAVKSTGQ